MELGYEIVVVRQFELGSTVSTALPERELYGVYNIAEH